MHYFNSNTGSKKTYEPNITRGDIKSNDDIEYKGEIYVTKGSGKVFIESYVPGKIIVNYSLDTISEIEINTNFLGGWKSKDPDIEVLESRGLVLLKPLNHEGKVEINYFPLYLYFITPLFILGLIITFISLNRLRNNHPEANYYVG